MNKTVLASLAILTLSTSAALAWTHHSRAVHPNASAAAVNPNHARPRNAYAAIGAPPAVMPGVSSKNHDMYLKNLHDSGYNPKNDFTKSGTIAQH